MAAEVLSGAPDRLAPVTRVVSFFTGAGGLDLGLAEAGLAPEVTVEVEPTFCKTLELNLGGKTKIRNMDVETLRGKALTKAVGAAPVDLVVGGPPCQSFSTGGGRAALNDPRGNLIFEFLRVVGELQPRAFVLENVANLITAAVRHRPISQRPGARWNLSSYTANGEGLEPDELSGSAVNYLLGVLQEQLGYAISLGILNAAEHGAPQRRHRLVIVGARDGKAPQLPLPTHGPTASLPYATVRDAIWDLQDSPGPGPAYTDATRRVFDLVPEGGNWRSLPIDVARAALGERSFAAGGGKTGFFRRLAWDQPSPTITGKSNRKGSALCHPSVTRPLSLRECARLQGFPDAWTFAGSFAEQALQVGNAVPVALGEAIGRTMAEFLGGSGAVETREVTEMLDEATKVLRATARNNRPRRVPA